MDDKLIELINEKTPIVDLVSEFVTLQKKGKNFSGLCPFHQEKTPSFFVSPEKNICKCYGCGEGGSPINFLRKIKNISFDQAAHELAQRAGIEVKDTTVKKDPYSTYYELLNQVASFYEFNLRHSEKGLDAIKYLYERQMIDEHIKHFRIGYAPSHGSAIYQLLKNKGFNVSDMIKLGVVKQNDKGEYYDLFADRIIFPITNPKGQVVGFSGRTMNPKESVKYMNSPESLIFKKGLLLYHFHEALPEIRKEKHVILYEGFFDVIQSYAAGIKHGVATMGTALTKDQAKLIKSVTPSIVIAYDGDQAGLKASEHAIPILDQENLKVNVLTIPEKMDPDDFIKAYGPEAFEKLFGEYLEDSYQFRYRFYKMGKQLTNANDLKAFKKQVMDMVLYADPSIRAIYVQRLAQEFNIPIDELTPTQFKPKKEVVKLPTKERPKTPNRYEKAERYLIFGMLRSKETAQRIMSRLKSTDYAEVITASIRLSIDHYYLEHDVLDIPTFLDTCSMDVRTFIEQELFKDELWKKNIIFDQDEIDHYVRIVMTANSKRRFEELCAIINKSEGAIDQAIVLERDRLKNLLSEEKNKEE